MSAGVCMLLCVCRGLEREMYTSSDLIEFRWQNHTIMKAANTCIVRIEMGKAEKGGKLTTFK